MFFTAPNIVIGSVLLLGYLFMLISVINQPAQDSQQPPSSKEVLHRLQKEKKEQYLKIQELQHQLEISTSTESLKSKVSTESLASNPSLPIPDRPGVIILGMHRSGTSILGGLMNKMGLKTGGPLINPGGQLSDLRLYIVFMIIYVV